MALTRTQRPWKTPGLPGTVTQGQENDLLFMQQVQLASVEWTVDSSQSHTLPSSQKGHGVPTPPGPTELRLSWVSAQEPLSSENPGEISQYMPYFRHKHS